MHSTQYIKKYAFGLALMLSLFAGSELKAQIDLKSALISAGYEESKIEIEEVYNMPSDGNLYRANYWDKGYYDLVLPDTIAYPYLYTQVRGADGGTNWQSSNEVYIPGGQGATIWTNFKIGTGSGEIQPGGTLRFLIGQGGDRDTKDSRGGSGTGLAYKNPETEQWSILVVAGGGGGAGGSEMDGGVPGQITEDGSPGRHYGGNGGSDGKNGKDNSGSYSAAGEPGKGINKSMKNDEPIGSKDATWGFGGGGDFNRRDDNSYMGGGGGGGYSGGGGGKRLQGAGGGGGGSYVNPDFDLNSIKLANYSTTKPKDGYVDFQFVEDPKLVSKEFESAAAPGKCLDLLKGNTANYTTIQLYECTGRSPQQWIINGLHIYLAKNTEKCVNLQNADMEQGDIQLRDCDDRERQLWIYDGFSGAFRSGKNPDYCMNLVDANPTNDTNVKIATCDDSNQQKWLIEGTTLVDSKSGVKTIHLAQDTEMCLDLYKGKTDNSTSQVQIYQCTGGSPQQWVFDGLRIKYNKDQNKCLNLDGGNTAEGTIIKVRDCYDPDDKARQHWIYDGVTQSFRSGKNPEKCLQVAYNEDEEEDTSENDQNEEEDTFKNDQKVEIADCLLGDTHQQWVIE